MRDVGLRARVEAERSKLNAQRKAERAKLLAQRDQLLQQIRARAACTALTAGEINSENFVGRTKNTPASLNSELRVVLPELSGQD